MDYVSLRKKVIEGGLLDRQYGYYAFKIISTLAMAVGFGFLLFSTPNVFVQFFSVVGIAFSFVQVAFLGHDAGHRAIFKSDRLNDAVGLLTLGFLDGTGYNYWVRRHNEHHANPNHESKDPDFTAFAQTTEELARKKGFARFVYERQHWFYPFIVSMYAVLFQVNGAIYNFRLKNSFMKLADSFFMVAHIGFFALPFFFFAWWKAAAFVLLWRLLMGAYFGTVSATNHKGMTVVREGQELGFIEKQLLTTRNVRRGLIVDFVYGGLNYQLEHHLFPTMPRVNFSKCKPLVMKFCRENGLLYEETGVVESYMQIIGALRKVAISARKNKKAPESDALPTASESA